MNRLMTVVAGIGFLSASIAQACPCGCGSIAAGILEPGQTTKFITSASAESQVMTITGDGEEVSDYLYDRSLRSDFVVTQAIVPRVAFTAGIGAYRNTKGDRTSDTMPADASMSLGYTVMQQDFTRPWQPRVDAHVSYKHALAKSFEMAETDPTAESFLSVGGNGLQELALGTQTWSGMNEWKVGTSLRYVTFPEVLNGSADGPEAGGKAAVQLAKVFTAHGGLTLESGMEWVGEVTEDRKAQAGSARRIDHTSLSGSMVIIPSHSLGLTVARKNVFGLTRNSIGGQSITLSYQAVLL